MNVRLFDFLVSCAMGFVVALTLTQLGAPFGWTLITCFALGNAYGYERSRQRRRQQS